MSRREDTTNQQEEINDLIEELHNLRLDFERRSEVISLRLNRLQRRQNPPEIAIPRRGNPYSEQDIVRITNNYRNQRGIQGTVIRVTRRQVVLLADNNQRYTRSYNNVELVEPPPEEEDGDNQGAAQ
jgi:hypothetical protein